MQIKRHAHTQTHTLARTLCNIIKLTSMSSWQLAEEPSMPLYQWLTVGVTNACIEATTCTVTATRITVDIRHLPPGIIMLPRLMPAIHWTSPSILQRPWIFIATVTSVFIVLFWPVGGILVTLKYIWCHSSITASYGWMKVLWRTYVGNWISKHTINKRHAKTTYTASPQHWCQLYSKSNEIRQVAQLSQRNRAAAWVSFGWP